MSSEPASKPAADVATSPPPARVRGNLWTGIEVADVGALDASASVSVVVCGPDPAGYLPLTLAALAEQTYPAALTDVVVGFAPGELEQELREAVSGLELTLAPSARAPLAAADGVRGELVLLLPAGAMPVRDLVEAHARWHHAVADAVTVGVSRRVDGRGVAAADVARAQHEGTLDELLRKALSDDDDDDAEALAAYLESTRDLTERRPDSFRVAARGSLGVRASTMRAAGGAGELSDPALARLELAYRLDCAGCVLVPEHRARTFEPYAGAGTVLAGAAEQVPGLNGSEAAGSSDPRVAGLVPAVGFRARGSGRRFPRPAMVVNLSVGEETAGEILETVDAVLRGRFQDLELRIGVPDEHQGRELIAEACAADPRIVLGEPSTETGSYSPYQVMLPPIAMPDDRTFEEIHELLTEEGMGALHVTVPGELPRNAMVEAVATGPLSRARRVAAVEGEEPEVTLGRLFGERWVSGVEVGVRRRGDAEPRVTEHGPLAPATDLEHERTQHLRHSSRAATTQAKAARYAQRAARERIKARAERVRAERLEQRIERTRSSRAYALLRPLRRVVTAARSGIRR